MQASTEQTIVKLLSTPEWQKEYKNFVYQYTQAFAEAGDPDTQRQLYERFQSVMNPICAKYLTLEQISEYKQNCKQVLATSPEVIQILSLCDFKLFQAEMAQQNEMLDLIALELIRKEQGDDSDEDDEEEERHFEQERENAKLKSQGKPLEDKLFERKMELERSIKESLNELCLPRLDEVSPQQQQEVDGLGFNKGVKELEEDPFRKSIKLRAVRLKQTVPKQQVKVATVELKKRRLQFERIKNALKEIS